MNIDFGYLKLLQFLHDSVIATKFQV